MGRVGRRVVPGMEWGRVEWCGVAERDGRDWVGKREWLCKVWRSGVVE